MAVVRQVNIHITGQVPDDWDEREYEKLMAALRLVAATYDLTIEEN